MAQYMITHSLLSAWLYAMKDNPYEDSTTEWSAHEDFLRTLRREPSKKTEAMLRGIDFEDLVTDIMRGGGGITDFVFEAKTYDAAVKVAKIVSGAQLQVTSSKTVNIDGVDYLLYGRLDALKAGTIYDIKFSKSYDRGKYVTSTQHPMYFELIPGAERFTYIISDGTNVWTESYEREETPSIIPLVGDFIHWLNETGLIGEYLEHWVAL